MTSPATEASVIQVFMPIGDEPGQIVRLNHRPRGPVGKNDDGKPAAVLIGTFEVDPETDEWLWHGSVDELGIPAQGKPKLNLRREVYQELVGLLDKYDYVRLDDSKTMNSRDLNPDHMLIVTRGEEALTRDSPMARNAERTHCVRGHPLSGDNLYVYPSSGSRSCKICRNLSKELSRERQKVSRATVKGEH